ncbi:aldo/keto reductase [Streptomyces sp. MNP-20]|uniref:aldo/keto reductase n=1 Tax=Streptomyces sp. MNP-20 TaxID=2721165 RepID=UPI00155788E7|nr:aldo/keto reductase [Streptomyces sp. MNP-20]
MPSSSPRRTPSGPSHRRCGSSGLVLSALGLSLADRHHPPSALQEPLVSHALELGITHFDISATAGSPPQQYTEIGRRLRPGLAWRDEMVISVRIGLGSGPQPLTGFGARKQILSGLEGILRHTGLDYVDVLYAHRLDRTTPLEESMGALASAVHSGKALYAGLSAFPAHAVRQASTLLSQLGTPPVAYQGPYSLLDRGAEDGLFTLVRDLGMGFIACAPLAQGRLARHRPAACPPPASTPDTAPRHVLTRLADTRGQAVEQLALAWCLREATVASALTTTSQLAHLTSDHAAACSPPLSPDELTALDQCRFPTPRSTPGTH